MTKLSAIAVLLAGVVASLIQAPSAAGQPDSQFCKDMAAVGYTRDCATLTSLAKYVCAQYDRGVDWETVLQTVDARTKDEGLSNYIMAGAPLYFCPEHAGKT